MPAPLAPLLRECVESGRFAPLAERLGPETVLDSSSERGRRKVRGPGPIVDHLQAPGPGTVVDWDAREWESGVAVTFEWRGAGDVDRRRWYIRRHGDLIAGWWSYAARPRSTPAPGAQLSEAVLTRIGAGARRAPLAHGGNSGAALERVLLPDGTALVAKRVGPAADWLGRVTRDRGRTALLWDAGAFARMPPELEHGIAAVVPDGDGWWVVMRDLSDSFLGDERRLSRAESARILRVAARLHREFAGEDAPAGAAALADRLGMSSPLVADRERSGPDLLPKQIEAAWDAFAESVPGDVAGEILVAARRPAPLATALLDAGPRTLLHGDLRDDNLGLRDDGIVLLDWDLATVGTPTVEFAWYLLHDAWRIDAGHDEIEADYRAAEGNLLRPEEVELGLLTGLVQYGWILGHSLRIHPDPAEQEWARAELGWWIPRTRRALERTGGMPR